MLKENGERLLILEAGQRWGDLKREIDRLDMPPPWALGLAVYLRTVCQRDREAARRRAMLTARRINGTSAHEEDLDPEEYEKAFSPWTFMWEFWDSQKQHVASVDRKQGLELLLLESRSLVLSKIDQLRLQQPGIVFDMWAALKESVQNFEHPPTWGAPAAVLLLELIEASEQQDFDPEAWCEARFRDYGADVIWLPVGKVAMPVGYKTDPRKVQAYVRAIKGGHLLEPIWVEQEEGGPDGRFWQAKDGRHRLQASIKAGKSLISARVR